MWFVDSMQGHSLSFVLLIPSSPGTLLVGMGSGHGGLGRTRAVVGTWEGSLLCPKCRTGPAAGTGEACRPMLSVRLGRGGLAFHTLGQTGSVPLVSQHC